MNKSIANMNRTIGERELNPTGVKLAKLETLAIKLEVAYSLQAQTGWNNIIEKGNNMEASVLADLVDMLNTDPAHIITHTESINWHNHVIFDVDAMTKNALETSKEQKARIDERMTEAQARARRFFSH